MRGLAQTLVLTGVIPPAVASDAVARFGESRAFEDYLVRRKFASRAQIAEAIALQTQLQYVELSTLQLDPKVVASVPPALCRKYRVIPVSRSGDHLTLAMADPTDIIALDDIGSATGLLITPVVADSDVLAQMLDRYVRSDQELSSLSQTLESQAEEQAKSLSSEADASAADSVDAPIVRFVNLLIAQAIQDRASDIHLEPGEHSLRVRYRIDGVLHDVQKADRAIQDGVISRLKIMSGIDIAERRRPQDGRMSVVHEGRKVDLRVATLPTVWGENVVMRILDRSESPARLSDLNMSDENMRRFRATLSKSHGMILFTGPTGSGKSTALYTTLTELAMPEVNVITVEDPVEKRIAGVNQVQINSRAGLTFADALRSILRMDPDIVLVGEIRDRETASISIEASLTGHLVLSTLHTNDAPSALTRMVEIGVEPYLVGSAITCVVAQRLARQLCEHCKDPYEERRSVLDSLGFPATAGGGSETVRLYKAVGCSMCSGTGFRSRIAIHEVMPMTETLEQKVVLNAPAAELRDLAVAEGMLPLRSDGWSKVLQGLTTIDEVLRVAG